MFWTPERKAPSAWTEHVPFAFWLVDVLHPSTIVELGTHNGVSYSAMCQAVKSLRLPTRCYAVDTWKGDEHAGFYPEEIYRDFATFHDQHYSAFSRLVRSTFDEALAHFEERSIDLLHIDGLHTYNAVAHDFQSWLPKLSPNAVILFHDTNVREKNFGVFRLWNEIAAGRLHFTFLHGHGLGVLGLGRNYPNTLRSFFDADENNHLVSSVREVFASLGNSASQLYERTVLDQTLAERKVKIAALDQALDKWNRELGELRNALTERDINIAVLDRMLVERDAKIAALDQAMAERDTNLAVLDRTLVEREAKIAVLDRALADRESKLGALQNALSERDTNIASLESTVSALRKSTSWRITAPLRWTKRLLGRMRYSAGGYPLDTDLHVLRTRLPAPLHTGRGVRDIVRERIYLVARGVFNRLPISDELKRRLKLRVMYWRCILSPMLLASSRTVTDRTSPPEFAAWINANEPSADDLKKMVGDKLAYHPVISIIIPVYKIPSHVLAAALESIAQQSYPIWEACVAYAGDSEANWKLIEGYARRDSRYRVTRIGSNLGIAANSNEALRLATGEFIALLDHDDTIAPWALYAMVKKINESPDTDFLFSDKDCISEDGGHRINPLFKPEWSPEMLYSVNYLTHFNVMRRSIVNEVGGFRPETDGAQDWDLFLRVTERSRRVSRVVGILYHWRLIATSTSTGIAAKPFAHQAQLRTIEDRIKRLVLAASAELHDECGFRIRWNSHPWEADIVIDGEGADRSRIDDLLVAMPQERIRSVIIATSAEATCEHYPLGAARWRERLTILNESLGELSADDAPLRRVLSADTVVFMSSQIVRFGPDFLTELGGWCMGHPDIAFASSLVLDVDERVIEAGAIVDPDLNVAPLFSGSALRSWEGFGSPLWYRNCSAASPWAVAMRREAFEKIGGLDLGSTWQEAFISLCLRLRAEGLRGMVNPHSRVYVKSAPTPTIAAAAYVNDPYFHPAFAWVCPLRLVSTQ